MRMLNADSEDVYDLDDEFRESLHTQPNNRDTFAAVGVDDYVDTDKVLRGNGGRFFATKL